MVPQDARPNVPLVLHRKRPEPPRPFLDGEFDDAPGEITGDTVAGASAAPQRRMRGILSRHAKVWKAMITNHLILTWVINGFPL